MSRIKKQGPCEYCEDEGTVFSEDVSSDLNLSLSVESYPENNFIDVSLVGVSPEEREININWEIPMNYCPKCGRRLGY